MLYSTYPLYFTLSNLHKNYLYNYLSILDIIMPTFSPLRKISSVFPISIRKYCKESGKKSPGSIWNYFKNNDSKKDEVLPLEGHTKANPIPLKGFN